MTMVSGRPSLVSVGVLTLASLLLLVPSAWAQQASGIAGVVKDTPGAVLPGVTVEASSPALIEKVRAVVTSGEGRYNIIDLRPGTYVVTFSLPGFNTARREGIVLTSSFTATVNADMQVGAVEETVTVTGEAPLVDTTNVKQQKILADSVLTALLVTGFLALTGTATAEYANRVFWLKMYILFAAMIFTVTVRRLVTRADEAHVGPFWGKFVGLVSIALWTSVAVSARLIMFLQ